MNASASSKLLGFATDGLTTGAGARPFTVGSAGVRYGANPIVNLVCDEAPDVAASSGIDGRSMDAEVLADVSARAPQNVDEFVRMYASTDGRGGVDRFISDESFTALQSAWDEHALTNVKSRMIHAFWVYSSLMRLSARTKESLARFEGANPGRGEGKILNTLARATHTAWLDGEKKQSYFTPYTQSVHDFITSCIEKGIITSVSMETHTDPRKKFKLKVDGFTLPEDARSLIAFSRQFEQAVGRALDSGFMINTVGGEWKTLSSIRVAQNPEWAALRPEYLFGLQTDNVAAVLFGLENAMILSSLGEGSTADKIQSLIEMLRIINTAWRVNNPWGGINSPLIGKPFALEEDGGIGIGDIVRDAVTLRSTLEELEAARIRGIVNLPDSMGVGIRAAFANGLSDALEVIVDQAALAVAVRFNTEQYNSSDPLADG